MLPKITRVASRELTGYFASPAAFLFLAAFLGATPVSYTHLTLPTILLV